MNQSVNLLIWTKDDHPIITTKIIFPEKFGTAIALELSYESELIKYGFNSSLINSMVRKNLLIKNKRKKITNNTIKNRRGNISNTNELMITGHKRQRKVMNMTRDELVGVISENKKSLQISGFGQNNTKSHLE